MKNKSVAFKQAHILTRTHLVEYPEDHYQVMFGYYLSELTKPVNTTAGIQL